MEANSATFLNDIRVAAPCTANWNEMSGDERVRHCALCRKNVYNLSSMSRAEAESLVREKEGDICIRFHRRADGTVLTENCPVGLRAVRRRLTWLASGVAALFALGIGTVWAKGGAQPSVSSLRQMQPFSTLQKYGPVRSLMNWFDPPVQTMVVGKMACPRPVPAAPAINNPGGL